MRRARSDQAYTATVAVSFSIAGVIHRRVSKTDKLRLVQHDPVPTGVMAWPKDCYKSIESTER